MTLRAPDTRRRPSSHHAQNGAITAIPQPHDEFGNLKLSGFPRSQRQPIGSTSAFNEVSTETGLRPRYQRLLAKLFSDPFLTNNRKKNWFRHSPLGDSIKIAEVPLVLTKREHDIVQRGNLQIGEALRALWLDVIYEKHPSILKAGILPLAVLNYGFRQQDISFKSLGALRRYYNGISQEASAFSYGVDLMRLPSGRFAICEINVGDIGGRSDVDHVNARFQGWHRLASGKSWDSGPYQAPTTQYRAYLKFLIAAFPEFAATGLCTYPLQDSLAYFRNSHLTDAMLGLKTTSDLESYRCLKEMERLGIPSIVAVDQPDATTFPDRATLLLHNDAISCSALLEPFKAGRLRLANSPGSDILLSNKLLLGYWEKIVRFFCREEPILHPIPSAVAKLSPIKAGRPVVNTVYGSDQSWPSNMQIELGIVRKGPLTNGGHGVDFVFCGEQVDLTGRSITREELFQLSAPPDHLKKFECLFTEAIDHFLIGERFELPREDRMILIQPICRPSVINGHAVDIRPFGQIVGTSPIYAFEAPWGRVSADQVSKSKKVQTNVTLGALELPVLIEREDHSD